MNPASSPVTVATTIPIRMKDGLTWAGKTRLTAQAMIDQQHPDRAADGQASPHQRTAAGYRGAGRPGPPHADLLGPLDDRHEHDVGDHDRADHERDAGNQDHQQERSRRDVAPEVLEELGRDEAERIVLVELRLAQRPQDRAHLVRRNADCLDASLGLDEDPDVVGRRDVLLEDRQRHVDDVVLALAHHVALLGERADDLDRVAGDLEDPADRSLFPKAGLDIPADNRDRLGVVVLGLRE
jgi:hypothetical protein